MLRVVVVGYEVVDEFAVGVDEQLVETILLG